MNDELHASWDVDEAKRALDTELMVDHEGDDSKTKAHTDIAKRKLTESTALAVDRIIHTALYSESESLAFKAATYIVDRVLGKVDSSGIHREEEDEYTKLMSKVFTAN